MIFLLPPKYRYTYWGCVLTGGAIIIGLLSVGLLVNGSIIGAGALALFDMILILSVRHVVHRIIEIRAEEVTKKKPI